MDRAAHNLRHTLYDRLYLIGQLPLLQYLSLTMAPRKEKVEKVSANEAADTILDYLRTLAHASPTPSDSLSGLMV